MQIVNTWTEGSTDTPFAQKLITTAGLAPGLAYEKTGKANLIPRIRSISSGRPGTTDLALVDLDLDYDCPVDAIKTWFPHHTNENLVISVIPREVEAWALASPDELAEYLSVARSKLPNNPESLQDPKQEIINLCRKSRRRAIRDDAPPRPGSSRSVGPAYGSLLAEFAEGHWNVEHARSVCPSLERAILRVKALGDNA